MKNRITRRDLFALTGASLIPPPILAQPQEDPSTVAPDMVVFNAKVITVDPQQPRAEAFAIKNGRVLVVGSNPDVRNLIRRGTPTWDAKGAAIVPGFIDTHNHKLRARAAQTPAGTWVEGYFFDDTKVKDGRPLTVKDLDQVSKDHPVAVHHRGGHTSFYNSKAFELADVNSQKQNPAGGTFDRDSSGALNGRVTDNANNVFHRVGKRQTVTEENSGLDAPVDGLDREIAGTTHISKMFAR